MKTRIERLRAGFEKQYIDAFLVTDKTNLRYLTGFDLEQGMGAVSYQHRRRDYYG